MANSIQLLILEVIRGTESKSVITIWDGTDIECSGNFSMKASGMAFYGDTILAVLPKIQSIQNPWDVVGDYRRPAWLYATPVLKIQNDTLRGLVAGNSQALGPLLWLVLKMNYAEFRSGWSNTFDCSLHVSIEEENVAKQPLIKQEGTKLLVSFSGFDVKNFVVTSLEGRIISKFTEVKPFVLNMENYAAGMYLLNVTTDDGRFYRFKIVR